MPAEPTDPTVTLSTQVVAQLQRAFEAWLIAETKQHGSIPAGDHEELALAEAIAAVLADAKIPPRLR